MKKIVKKVLPEFLIYWLRRQKLSKMRKLHLSQTTEEVFTNIYYSNEWGGVAGELCSGSGSALDVTEKYCELVREFVCKNKIKSLLDLGCGDFSVGRNFHIQNVFYTGVDIVRDVVNRNNENYGTENIKFKHLNIIEDDLPDAELCLVRQVFQHLSNDQIIKVLDKLKKYNFVIITEHYPPDGLFCVPNIDKPHGGDTRLLDNSAVYLDQPPFNVQGLQTMLEVNATHCLVNNGERIKTFLLHYCLV